MTYFRYAFLNSLRDGLYLTATRQKVTLVALIQLLLPAIGIGCGIGRGMATHSWVTGTLEAVLGLLLGVAVSWGMPRLLWWMLQFFAERGWFVLGTPPQRDAGATAQIMTITEFESRVSRERVGEGQRLVVGIGSLLILVFCFLPLFDYLERTKSAPWVQTVAGLAFLGALGCFATARFWWQKKRLKGLGLLCPNCSRTMTDPTGSIGAGYEGRCRHCGVRMVDVTGPGQILGAGLQNSNAEQPGDS